MARRRIVVARELRRHVGQLLIAGFDGHGARRAAARSPASSTSAASYLFARNVESPEQVAELSFEAARLAPELPLWVSVDQEGGRVARLRAPFTEWPPMATLGRSAQRVAGRAVRGARWPRNSGGRHHPGLRAPVLDVLTNPDEPGDRRSRADATRPAEWPRLGAAVIRGLQAEGIAACGKHFPGHGDTSVDSHHELPVVEHPPDRLDAVEFVPFRAAIEADVASLMTAHLLVPALDEERPATLSPRVVDGRLRRGLGFDGVIFSDDLEMKAIAEHVRAGRGGGGGHRGGVRRRPDLQRDTMQQWAALEALIHAVEGARPAVARRRRPARASAGERALRGFDGLRLGDRVGGAAAATARLRGASGDRRGDGGVA